MQKEKKIFLQVLKLLGGSVKKRRKARGLTSYGSVSSLPTSSVSSRPVTRHHDKRRSHVIDDRMKKAKDIKVSEVNTNDRINKLKLFKTIVCYSLKFSYVVINKINLMV